MKEKYVCSLEPAKKLKELGVKQESDFYWVHGKICYDTENELHIDLSELWSLWDGGYKPQANQFFIGWDNDKSDDWNLKNIDRKQNKLCNETLSAFHVGELGEMLEDADGTVWTEYYCGIVYCRISRFKSNEVITDRRIEADTEANARAKMLIYLIENKLITLANG